MRWSRWGLAVLVAVAGLALWLLLAGPDRLLGLDSGNLGVALSALVAWTALSGISAAPTGELEHSVSPGEWQAWIGLAFTGLIATYGLAKAPLILAATDMRDLGPIGRNIVLLFVAWTIVSRSLEGRWKGRVIADERDREIEVRASGWARTALTVAVIAVTVTLGMTPSGRLDWATPIVVAHLLIFGLISSCLVEYAVTAVSYWRDRR